jgi:hypothetical protein
MSGKIKEIPIGTDKYCLLIITCPFVPLVAPPCLPARALQWQVDPSAIGCASGECRTGLTGWRACNGRRCHINILNYHSLFCRARCMLT